MISKASMAGFARRTLLFITFALAASGGAGTAAAAETKYPPVAIASRDAFWSGDFLEIERQNAEFRQPGRFGKDGSSPLSEFRWGLNLVFDNSVDNAEAYFKELDLLTLQWANEHPKSAFAHSLHARALVAHAWSYRGGGYTKDVPPEAWKDFHAYLQRAAQYIKAHAEVALTDSYAHNVLLMVGRGLSLPNAQLLAITDDGLKRNPDDVRLYREMAESLLPKWGGTPRQLDDYIKSAAERTRDRFGQGMYTRLYLSAAEDQFGHALFEDSFVDWDRMKQGFEDLLARFPDTTANLNAYAYMACLAKDRDTFLKQFVKIDKQIDKAEWGSNPERSVEGCRRWAASS